MPLSQGSHAVPFNERLTTSTPTLLEQPTHTAGSDSKGNTQSTVSPWKYIPDKNFMRSVPGYSFTSSEGYHLTVGGNNPLNSTDQCKTVAPPKIPDPVPKLVEGKVDFEPNPLPVDSVHLELMPWRELYRDVHGTNYSLYSSLGNSTFKDGKTNNVPTLGKSLPVPSTASSIPTLARSLPLTRPSETVLEDKTDQKYTPISPLKVPSPPKATSQTQHGPRKVDIVIPHGESIPPQQYHKSFCNEDKEAECKDSTVRNVHFIPGQVSAKSIKETIVSTSAKYEDPAAKTSTSIGVQAEPIEACHSPETPTPNSNTSVENEFVEDHITEQPTKPSKPQKKLQALHHLLKELKAITCSHTDREVHRLVRDIEETSDCMVWGKKTNRQLEIDLAMQPLRSENANLRRQLRIANAKLKDKDNLLNNAQKPDPNFQIVHLDMLRLQLEKSLREERAVNDRLRQRTGQLQQELDKVTEEKRRMLDIVSDKDCEMFQSTQDLIAEKNRLLSEIDRLKQQRRNIDKQMETLRNERQLERVTMEQKDQEINKLQELVGSLQLSMTKLLHDLQSSRPDPAIAIGCISDGIQEIDSMLHENPFKRSTLLSEEIRITKKDGQASSSEISKPANQGISLIRRNTFHNTEKAEVVSPVRRSLNFLQQDTDTCKTSDFKPAAVEPVHIDELRERVQTGDFQICKQDTCELEMTVSEYDLPPGASPLKHSYGQHHRPEKESSHAPTLKDLLTPIADRMQNQFQRLSTGGRTVSDKIAEIHHPSVVHEDEDISGFSSLESEHSERDEGDSTLIEEENKVLVEVKEQKSLVDEHEQSRFSFTDYFKKYPKQSAQQSNEQLLEYETSNIETENQNDSPGISDDTELLIARFRPKDHKLNSSSPKENDYGKLIQSSSGPSSSGSRPSMQSSIYKGTDLDTSLSTIPKHEDDDDDASVMTGSTAASTDSISSIDDHAFKQGLAALDANIARMQQQLKVANYAI